MPSGIDWDEIERQQRCRRRPRMYAVRLCPYCGHTIGEGAWGRRDSNWKRHAAACEKRRADDDGQKTGGRE